MRQTILCLAFLLFFFTVGNIELNGQPSSLYYLKSVPQTKDLNPARPGIDRGFYVSLPLFSKLDLSANANNWSYNDLIHKGIGAQSDSLVMDFKKYLSALDKNNFLYEYAALTLIEFGWKKETDFFAFSWTEKEVAEVFFTKNLANLIYYGNAPYLGSTYHSGYFGGTGQHYREFAFTFARDMTKKLSVGITGKLLFGMSGIKTSGLNVVAGMPASGDQIDMGASGRVFMSAPVDIQITNNNGYNFYGRSYYDRKTYLTNFANPGMAIDIGFANRISKKFEFSMSLIDLGFISWNKNINSFSENGKFLFRGINLNTQTATNNPPNLTDVSSLLLPWRDSLRVAFYQDQTNSNFMTLLPVKLYIAGEYKISENYTFGGVARVRMFNNLLHTSFTASANAAFTRKFSMSASYSVMESTVDNLGVAAAYRFGIFQLYAASDNVRSMFYPSTANNMNLRIGINLIFQDEAKQRKGVYKKGTKRSDIGCPVYN
jgi:hypothetical protein